MPAKPTAKPAPKAAAKPPADGVLIRHLQKKDMDSLADLWSEFARFREGLAPGKMLSEDAVAWFLGYAHGLFDRRDALVLGAYAKGQLVGYLIAIKQRKPPIYAHTQVAYLSDAYVREGHRGHGILGRFSDEMTKWCKREGITAVDVQLFTTNQDALAVYKKLGFKEYRMLMRLELGQPQAKAAYE